MSTPKPLCTGSREHWAVGISISSIREHMGIVRGHEVPVLKMRVGFLTEGRV